MNKSIFMVAASVLISGAMLTSCTSPSEKVANAAENVKNANAELDKANDEYLEDIVIYRRETAEKITANEKFVKELKAKAKEDKKAIKSAYNDKIEALEQQNSDMKKKLDEYEVDGKEKWVAFKTEFSHDMDELGKAFKDLTVKNVE